MSKTCRSCGWRKNEIAFWPCEGTPDGLQYDCIECLKKQRIVKATAAAERDAAIKRDDPANYDAAIVAQLYYQSRKRAKEKGIEHTLSKEDIPLVHVCPVRLVELKRSTGRFNPDSYTLDRVDSSKGYIPGNVRVLSWLANNLKNNLSVEDIERLLQYMKGTL